MGQARKSSHPSRYYKYYQGLGIATCEIEHEPLGVALVLSAWNYPIYTAIPQVAAAISAGNCVLLKPSELAPEASGVIKKLFD